MGWTLPSPPGTSFPMRFRTNVAAVVRDDAGRILICERRDVPGAWQFPQGGVNDGETLEQALARELYEEIMLHPESYRVVGKRGPYEYRFPSGIRKRGFDGQRRSAPPAERLERFRASLPQLAELWIQRRASRHTQRAYREDILTFIRFLGLRWPEEGDRLLALFARNILAEKPGAVILGEVKCSRGLYEDIEKHGGKAIMWRTGHSHLKAAMKQFHAELAGEMSGHIFFKHRWYGFDDALYSGARLLEIIANSDQPLSAHLATIPKRVSTPEIEFSCPDEKKFEIVRKLVRYFKDELKFQVVTIDGARIEFPDGWGLIRASNTSPKLVMRVEADNRKRMLEIEKLIREKVDELLG